MQRLSFAGRFVSLRKGVGLMLLAIAYIPASEAQEALKPKVHRKDSGWKLSVISDVMPGKVGRNLRTEIEDERLVCRSPSDVPLLEIPLKTITQVTRDTEKDYRVSRWLMMAATQPSREHHTFGSKEHREQLKARVGLTLTAMIAALFPSHKEAVHVTWSDEEGTHYALFYLGRSEGRAMLARIKQETGLEPRDLENERKAEKKRLKALHH